MMQRLKSHLAQAEGTVCRRIEHCDIDGYGVVHFSRYAAFFETAALAKLERLGYSLADLEAAGMELRVRQLLVHYRAAANYGDDLILTAQVKHLGVAHLQMAIRVNRDVLAGSSMVLAEGELNLVFVEAATGKPVPVPVSLNTIGGSCEF